MSKLFPPFKFKEFSVAHHKCAMKIGVDGVLIGAWTESNDPTEILDIGTGSGLISLMMQQKFPNAIITALEPNKIAQQQAQDNFNNSPFARQPNLELIDLQNFNCNNKFDLIISNPPFFEESVSSGDINRDQARQAVFLPIKEFIQLSEALLSINGIINFVYPTQQTNKILDVAKKSNLTLLKQTIVFPNKLKISKRSLFSFGKKKQETLKNQLFIKDHNGNFTQEYINLTKEFYINF